MILKRIEKMDLGALAALECAAFHAPWSEQALELLCGDGAFGFACMEGTVAVAYGGMLTVLDEGQITNIATHPSHRRQGLAARVMQALLDEARVRGLAFVTLEVRESNGAAIALYEKFGFSVLGKRKRFYSNPSEDAFVMGVTL